MSLAEVSFFGRAEQTVVVRFWIICGIFIAAGMGLFYAEWVVAQ